VCEVEEARRGPDPELTRLKKLYHEVVIPRYLRPLESDGRVLRPTLLHHDAGPDNVARRTDSTKPCLFGSSAIWGHAEGLSPITSGGVFSSEDHADLHFSRPPLHSCQCLEHGIREGYVPESDGCFEPSKRLQCPD
jgi:hypothetical protein